MNKYLDGVLREVLSTEKFKKKTNPVITLSLAFIQPKCIYSLRPQPFLKIGIPLYAERL